MTETTRASSLVKIVPGDSFETLRRCGGYYNCPVDESGCLGPLVGYAGKYEDEQSGEMKQYVGFTYYNYAKAEVYWHVLDRFAYDVAQKVITTVGYPDYVLGAPMGGLAFSAALARALDVRYGFADSKTIALATEGQREQTRLLFRRHDIEPGSKVLIGEDVTNNFSTTDQFTAIVEDSGSQVIAVVSELNRSDRTEWNGKPVISLDHRPTAQYRQEDPRVAEQIARGNIAWKPKDEWPRLMTAMQATA